YISHNCDTTLHHSLTHSYHAHPIFSLFFFNATAPPDIYTLSLHDALPISQRAHLREKRLVRNEPGDGGLRVDQRAQVLGSFRTRDRKSTRLNSSHVSISYAVFCLKKKKNK